jgi:hypothetical protein
MDDIIRELLEAGLEVRFKSEQHEKLKVRASILKGSGCVSTARESAQVALQAIKDDALRLFATNQE